VSDAALRASEIRFRHLFEAAKDGILMLGRKLREALDHSTA
jgi:hypothetical protein